MEVGHIAIIALSLHHATLFGLVIIEKWKDMLIS